jgi:hypothetical protein
VAEAGEGGELIRPAVEDEFRGGAVEADDGDSAAGGWLAAVEEALEGHEGRIPPQRQEELNHRDTEGKYKTNRQDAKDAKIIRRG